MADGEKTAADRALDSLKGTAPKRAEAINDSNKPVIKAPKSYPAGYFTDAARESALRTD